MWLSKTRKESSGGASKLLNGDLNEWRGADVDDVEDFSEGEILVTDEGNGCESRGGGFAFETTKGKSELRQELHQKCSIGALARNGLRELCGARRRVIHAIEGKTRDDDGLFWF